MAARLGQIIYGVFTAIAVVFFLMTVWAYIEGAMAGFPSGFFRFLVSPLAIGSMAGTSWVVARGLRLGLTGK